MLGWRGWDYPSNEGEKINMEDVESLKAEIERLRAILRSCVRGPDPVDLGDGEVLALHLPHKISRPFEGIRRGVRAAGQPGDELK